MTASSARIRRLMSCLGEPSRFELVRLLARGERCVTDLAAQMGLSQSCTTRHLQVLQREGLAERRRDGKRVLFHLQADEPQVADLIAWAISARARPGTDRRPNAPRGRSATQRRGAPMGEPQAPPVSKPLPSPVHLEPPVRESPVLAAPSPRRLPGGDIEDYLL